MSEYQPLVLLVEDNPDVVRINRRTLTRAGYRVESASTLSGAEAALAAEDCDVLVLDILLPDGNALRALPKLRALTDAPVLFLSSLSEHADVLRGIEAGGDDYMTKPYKLDELAVRVTALWRREKLHRERLARSAARTVVRGVLTLDMVAGAAYLGGADMLLTGREFAVLLLLAQNEGATLPKQVLYEKAWGRPMAGDSQALYAVISRLKKKLEPAGGALRLTTVRPDGYRLSIG